MPCARTAALLIGVIIPAVAAAQATSPPALNCVRGFDGLKATAEGLPDAQWTEEDGYDIATLSAPERWIARIAFTRPGHPAHPAVTLRTRRKQVAEVWTADSKGCGYGDPSQFSLLMADMKSADTALTNASRIEVERRKADRPPLAP
ncbi:hypothetical protein [Hyphomicrobium sp.]|uniref:hypothetical protein n=1 Tax=Hyphomicrobium sp. TaxID=82 RepID=UPI002FE39126